MPKSKNSTVRRRPGARTCRIWDGTTSNPDAGNACSRISERRAGFTSCIRTISPGKKPSVGYPTIEEFCGDVSMLRPRITPCLLIKNGGLVKTVNFGNPKYVGDPVNAVKIFNEKEVDEIIVVDIDASVQQKEPDYVLIRN